MAHGVFAGGGGLVTAAQAGGAGARLARLTGSKALAPGRRPLDPASHGGKRVDAPLWGGALRAGPAQ